ncbi:MAG: hypothetical protein GXP25_23500 [Planctomycetes bacterium]|nr:hypothetical protein [Planctomycetota bacterium]
MTHDLAPGVQSRIPLEELRRRYARCDIAAVDLDECMMPGFAQVILGRRIALRTLLRPCRFRDMLRIPRLIQGGCHVTGMRMLDLLGCRISRPDMMVVFERTLRGLPREYFTQAAEGIARFGYPMMTEALAQLAGRMPVGIVSFCLEIIVRQFVSPLNQGGHEIVSYYRSNRLKFRRDDGRMVLEGYDRSCFMTGPTDKRVAIEEEMAKRRAGRPLVIGHSDEDVGMAELARERKGIAIGFNPLRSCVEAFDVVASGDDWSSLSMLCRILGEADAGSG